MAKPTTVQVSTYWWDEQLQRDIPATSVAVTVWADVGNSTGRAFMKTCHNPQELWDYLHELNTDELAVLKEQFGYQPPVGRRVQLPADLSELFK